ncbi:MAG: polysaccharide deacetylase family protein [Clostridia bacterium]|nr:polysaccharide deacetylase family protein [Clostridia bacterium]
MYKKAHGIMCHHFHDEEKHIVSQGSISARTFGDILDYYAKDHNILNAEEFLRKSESNTLAPDDVCLTFDDGLLCQYDVAYPVMKERGLTAFWFIYTSTLDGVMERLEIYRHFRSSMFSDIDDFYSAFFRIVSENNSKAMESMKFYDSDEYLKEYPFYTPNDKRFRYLRDEVLGEGSYNEIMERMLVEYHYDIERNAKLLWLGADHIKALYQNGNVIGLHSYSHPTVMEKKSYAEQHREYTKNKQQLESIIHDEIVSISYPSNSYNSDTLKCVREMGLKIGFRANMADICLEELRYEYPREDHANILKSMEATL